jgi:hypothetical protein
MTDKSLHKRKGKKKSQQVDDEAQAPKLKQETGEGSSGTSGSSNSSNSSQEKVELEQSGNGLIYECLRFVKGWFPIGKIVILLMICTVSFMVRVFSVANFEAVIHEFDPWFNFRSTQFML